MLWQSVPVAKLMGVNLHRDKTLSTCDACCDYLYNRPGSEIEKKWQAEHPEGTFTLFCQYYYAD